MARRTPGRGAAVAALVLAVVLGGGGCLRPGGSANGSAATPADAPVKNADRYKVAADTTPFYHYGPQQLNGSDDDLKKDTRLTMLNRGRGYSQVRLPNNETGYVGTEDIAPLSPAEIAAEDAQKLAAITPAGVAATANARTTLKGPAYTIPPEAGNAEGLPQLSPTPTPPPAGIFRY